MGDNKGNRVTINLTTGKWRRKEGTTKNEKIKKTEPNRKSQEGAGSRHSRIKKILRTPLVFGEMKTTKDRKKGRER